jgi:hypothetical protein
MRGEANQRFDKSGCQEDPHTSFGGPKHFRRHADRGTVDRGRLNIGFLPSSCLLIRAPWLVTSETTVTPVSIIHQYTLCSLLYSRLLVRYINMPTHATLESFNPFAAHPFTSYTSAPPPTNAHYSNASCNPGFVAALARTPGSTPMGSPSSQPSAPASPVIAHPAPVRAQSKSKPPQKPIFEPFNPNGRSSPELRDILTKRSPNTSWPRK